MSDMSIDVVSTQLAALQATVDEVKRDVKEIKDDAPIHRISELEKWRSNINRWLGAVSLAVLGALLAAVLG